MKKKYLNYLLLLTLGLILMILSKDGISLFGSTTDWWNQHVAFASYFRDLFYQTGNLFPDFSFHLGSGMNLFYISYYGLYSPWLLLTYLFPGIPMVTCIQVIEIVTYLVSICMMYSFLNHKKVSDKVALFSSILFACSGPLLFHFHRQFMFVNYMPFVILGLYGVDSFFEKGKSTLLIISIFLIIMTSYYYSVSSLLALLIYSLTYLLEEKDKKVWVKEGTRLLSRMVIGILLSSILIIPSFFALLSGRVGGTGSSILSLFVPMISFWNVIYHYYTMGLSILAPLSLVGLIWSKKKPIKVICILLLILFIFPVFSAILNGGLYARGKVFIAFLPLVIYMISYFIEHLEEFGFSIPWKYVSLGLVVCMGIAYFSFVRGTTYEIIFLMDVVLSLLAIYLFKKKKTKVGFYLVILLVIPYAVLINRQEEYMKVYDYDNKEIRDTMSLIEQVEKEDNGLYRINQLGNEHDTINQIVSNTYQTSIYSSLENPYYKTFYQDVMKNAKPLDNDLMLANSLNPIFQSYMGVKYIISNYPLDTYTLKERNDNVFLYENEFALPMFYHTSQVYSNSSFSNLTYPNTLKALWMGAIAEKGETLEMDLIQEEDFGLSILEGDFYVTHEDQKEIPLSKKKEGVLLLSFDVLENKTCREGENLIITISGITNQQSCVNWTYYNHNTTFYYAIPLHEEIENLDMVIEEGTYHIENVHTYFLDYDMLRKYKEEITPFEVDSSKIAEEEIAGTITALEDGYFVSSLPYDTGYKIMVDGKSIPYEKVNTAFVGFPLEKGSHEITITYLAKGHNLGKTLSIVGGVLFLAIMILENRKKDVR